MTKHAVTFDDYAAALALVPDGSAYVTDYTASAEFPVTSAALQPNFGAPNAAQGTLVRLDPAGTVAYAIFIGGAFSQGTAIALDSAGAVFVSGIGSPGRRTASEYFSMASQRRYF